MENIAQPKLSCARCGFASEQPGAFIAIRRGTGSIQGYCRHCWRERFKRKNTRIIVTIVLGFALGAAVLIMAPRVPSNETLIALAWLEINLAFTTLVWPLNVAIHEFAHALAAKAVGMRLFRVQIGYGQPLFQAKLAGIDLKVNKLLFLGGLTFAGHLSPSSLRARQAAYVAAGPVSNLLLAGMLYLVTGRPNLGESLALTVQGPAFLQALLLCNLFIGALSLFPANINTAAGANSTDGMKLLGLLRVKQDFVEKTLLNQWILASSFAVQDEDHLRAEQLSTQGLERYPNQPALLTNLGIARLWAREFKTGRDAFVEVLEMQENSSPAGNPIQIAESLNNIAYADLLTGDVEYLREADANSSRACQLVPREPGYEETRGCVLIEMRRYEEGLDLLNRTTPHVTGAQALAIHHAYLALANTRLGHTAAAATHVQKAKKNDNQHPLVLRTLARLNEPDSLSEGETTARPHAALPSSDAIGVQSPDTAEGMTENRNPRTERPTGVAPWVAVTLGFLVAPLASGVLQSIIMLSPGAGIFTLIFAYPLALIMGVPAYLIFRRLRWLGPWQVVLTGAGLGAGVACMLMWATAPNDSSTWILLTTGIFILHGMVVAATFWWIAIRNPRPARIPGQ